MVRYQAFVSWESEAYQHVSGYNIRHFFLGLRASLPLLTTMTTPILYAEITGTGGVEAEVVAEAEVEVEVEVDTLEATED